MYTLPPLSKFLASLTSSLDLPLMSTGPKLLTVKADLLAGSTGTSPVPAALVTWIVPAGAESGEPAVEVCEAAAIDTGPPTRPSVFPGGTPSVLPLTEIAGGLAVRKPNAAGGAALKVLPSGLV